jgi:hypothetical protein
LNIKIKKKNNEALRKTITEIDISAMALWLTYNTPTVFLVAAVAATVADILAIKAGLAFAATEVAPLNVIGFGGTGGGVGFELAVAGPGGRG